MYFTVKSVSILVSLRTSHSFASILHGREYPVIRSLLDDRFDESFLRFFKTFTSGFSLKSDLD